MKLTPIAETIARQYGYTVPKVKMSVRAFVSAGGRLYTLGVNLKGRAP